MLSLTIYACGEAPVGPDPQGCKTPGEFSVLAPEQLRQGDVYAMAAGTCLADGTFDTVKTAITWTLADSTSGRVDSVGRFVAYRPGQEVQLVAETTEHVDTVRIGIEARGVSGTFNTVGLGFSEDRFTSDLWVHGDYAYTGTWSCLEGGQCGNRVNAWKVNSVSEPVLVDSVIVKARTVNDVKVSRDGQLAVVTREGNTADSNGITLLDLSQPDDPEQLADYSDGLENGVHNVWLEPPYLYVVENGNGGLHILDVSDPTQPVEVARYYAGSSFVHDVYVREGLAFVSHWNEGLIILDVGRGEGSPEDPKVVSRITTKGGNVHNAWYWPEAGYVFVGEEDFNRQEPGRMHVVNVENIRQPVEEASYFLPDDTPHNFWLDEQRGILFAAWYSNGLLAIDVTGRLLGRLDQQGRTYASVRPAGPRNGSSMWAPQLQQEMVFASDRKNGLWSFNFQVHERP